MTRGRRRAPRCLEKEKELTRRRDALAAERRRLPMGRIEKPYASQGPETFGPSVFLRDGRQEDREDSPEEWPKTPRYTWWRHHDRYEA